MKFYECKKNEKPIEEEILNVIFLLLIVLFIQLIKYSRKKITNF